MLRTHTCGELNENFVNQEVTLCGWVNTVRNLGALVFVDLRDKYGITQLNIPTSLFDMNKVRPEDVISAKGKVVLRSQPNNNIPTGLIEIEVSELKIFSHAETTPFEIKDDTTAKVIVIINSFHVKK